MRLADPSASLPSPGVPAVRMGAAPTELGRPTEAEEGDLELVGVRLLLKYLIGHKSHFQTSNLRNHSI